MIYKSQWNTIASTAAILAFISRGFIEFRLLLIDTSSCRTIFDYNWELNLSYKLLRSDFSKVVLIKLLYCPDIRLICSWIWLELPRTISQTTYKPPLRHTQCWSLRHCEHKKMRTARAPIKLTISLQRYDSRAWIIQRNACSRFVIERVERWVAHGIHHRAPRSRCGWERLLFSKQCLHGTQRKI